MPNNPLNTIKKDELVALLATRANVTKAAAASVLDAFTDVVVDRAAKGYDTRITNFGTFSRKVRKARLGRNPQTGQPMQVAEKVSVGFTSSATANAAL